MWARFFGGYAVFSGVLAWRLVGVVVNSADAEQRKSAVTMFGMVWAAAR